MMWESLSLIAQKCILGQSLNRLAEFNAFASDSKRMYRIAIMVININGKRKGKRVFVLKILETRMLMRCNPQFHTFFMLKDYILSHEAYLGRKGPHEGRSEPIC